VRKATAHEVALPKKEVGKSKIIKDLITVELESLLISNEVVIGQ